MVAFGLRLLPGIVVRLFVCKWRTLVSLYEIEQYEIHVQKYRVEADNAAAAIAQLRNGQADLVEGGSDYSGICEFDGLRVHEHPRARRCIAVAGCASR